MKKFLGIILAVAIMATMFAAFSFTTTVGAVATNLITGTIGTFEGATVDASWGKINASSTLAIATDQHHSGAQALKETGRTAGGYASPSLSLYSMLKTAGAGTYTASMWVYPVGTAATSALLRIRGTVLADNITPSASFMSVVGGNAYAGGTATAAAANTWTQLTINFTVTANDIAAATGTMNLCYDSIPTGVDVYVDDVSLMASVAPTATPAPVGTPAYKFTAPASYAITSGYVILDLLKTDLVVSNVYTVNVRNTGTNTIEVTASTRRMDNTVTPASEWGPGIASAKATIAAGTFATLTLAVTSADLHFVLDVNKIAANDSFVIGGNVTKSGVTGIGAGTTPNVFTYAQVDGTGLFTTTTAAPGATATPLPAVTGFQYKVEGTADTATSVVNLYLTGVVGHYNAATDTVTLYIMNTSTKSLNFQMCIGWAWDKGGDNKSSAIGDKVDVAAGKAVKLTVTGLKNYFEKTATDPFYDATKVLSATSVVRLLITGAAKDDTFVMAGISAIGGIKGNGASGDMIAQLTQITAPTALANLVNGVTTTGSQGTGDPSMVVYAFAAISGLGALVVGKKRFKK